MFKRLFGKGNEERGRESVERGFTLLKQGDVDKAIVAFEHAVRINPNDAVAYNGRGLAYAEMSEYARAITDYDRALSIDPNNDAAHNNREKAYAVMGEYGKEIREIADYTRAIAVDSKDVAAYDNRGRPMPEWVSMPKRWQTTTALLPLIRKTMWHTTFGDLHTLTLASMTRR